jgi:hypothetical protein
MKLIHEIGRGLYGTQWLEPLSDALGVHPRTVQRWGAERYAVPDGVWAEIAVLIERRKKELDALAEKVRGLS